VPCRAHLGEVQGRYDELRALGAEVMAVSFSPPAKVAAYLARNPLPFPAVADPAREGYRRFELGRTAWGTFFRPTVLAGYFKQIVRGWLPWRSEKGDDVLQLGGDFVLDGRRRLVYAYRSADPTDRPPAEDLVRAVRDSAGAPS